MRLKQGTCTERLGETLNPTLTNRFGCGNLLNERDTVLHRFADVDAATLLSVRALIDHSLFYIEQERNTDKEGQGQRINKRVYIH